MATNRINSKTKIAWIIWLVFTLIICAITIISHNKHTVSINYWSAANHWLQGQHLYSDTGAGYIYPPQSAILYIPFALLPFSLSELIWRIFSLGVFTYGLYQFSFLVQQYNFDTRRKSLGFYFLLLTLAVVCISFSSARNGQMHLLTTGLMLWAMKGIPEKKWWQTAGLILLAFTLKPTALVLLLLVGALYWQIGWRLMLGLVIYLLFPFLTQAPHYVLSQYSAFLLTLKLSNDIGVNQQYAQLFGLLNQAGWVISAPIQTLLRAMVAGCVLFWMYCIQKRSSVTTAAIWLFVLSMGYLMLFNPRTEGNDYIMLAPAIGFILCVAAVKKNYFQMSFLIGIVVMLIGSYYICRAFTPAHMTWIDPLMSLIFLGVAGLRLISPIPQAGEGGRRAGEGF